MVKVDGEIQRKTIVWLKLSPLIAIFDTNGLFDANKFFGAAQFFNTCIKQQINERSGTAIHNRDFRGVNFNNDVIDT